MFLETHSVAADTTGSTQCAKVINTLCLVTNGVVASGLTKVFSRLVIRQLVSSTEVYRVSGIDSLGRPDVCLH